MLGVVIQKTRMDVRIGISIIIKIIFFGLWFYQSGQTKYEGGHFATTLITWVVFHMYILCGEKSYIVFGENDINRRKKGYKLIDSVQSGILIIYFSVQVYVNNNQSVFNNISLTSLFIDIALNVDQLLKFVEKQKAISAGVIVEKQLTEDEEPNITGGEITLYISMVIGGGLAMGVAIVMMTELTNHPELQTFPFYTWSLYLCTIGEACFMIFVCYYLMPKVKKPPTDNVTNIRKYFRCYPSKHFLCMMYGFCIGLFSLYYAFFLGIYGLGKIIQKVLQVCGWIAKNTQSRVSPVEN
ncbi:unnamed protein product (macronuclear) [Paramecium tetraurelia]|uniref:Uncharacterized protein n=1 Tax=Paramecium tetraurelia TaxID=5888 RepID=A0C711_PARTE|nr:uncharacterized protein GSPATT00035707001 [Paramecium tetraurelia]CAK66578.1 unnamed protein product [Paramecium tetraurelia]|eukprot:XP_001433975.1 hypothetical protein (macronuclear) [Paramecium tetraurelia strain d4-2]